MFRFSVPFVAPIGIIFVVTQVQKLAIIPRRMITHDDDVLGETNSSKPVNKGV